MVDNNSINRTPEEFISLFSQHSLRIYGYIRTLVPNYQDANDVFQNSSCVLWKKYDEFTPNTNFFSWACQIARYEVLTHYRKKSNQHIFTERVLDELATEVETHSDQLSLRAEILAKCLEKLSLSDKHMIRARYHIGLKMNEIAKSLSISTASAYRLVSRIHDQLFRCVERALSREA
jgi:RNA polymerase sigma-70 factor (ECF subfamily)